MKSYSRIPWCEDGEVWHPMTCAAHDPDDGTRCAKLPARRCA